MTLLQRGPLRSLLLHGKPSIPCRQSTRFAWPPGPGALSTWARLLQACGAESVSTQLQRTVPYVLAQHPDLPRAKRVSYMPGASVDDLTKAAIVKLELGVTCADVNLCLEKGKPLCGLTQVEALGITAGAVVYVERVETS